ncbi:MAG: transglutaminaseTgpA domain-containing protein [Caldilineaceae bacterium]
MTTISSPINSRFPEQAARRTRSFRPRFAYAHNLYFQDGVLLTTILAGILYLIVAVSLDAAGYVKNMSLLVPVTMGAFVLGVLMAYSRFDGFFALSHSMFTGLAWILFLMATILPTAEEIAPIVSRGIPEFQAKAYFILLTWVNWVEAALTGAANAENYVFIFEISFLIWWLAYLGIWAVLRHGYTWRAIIPAGFVLLINTYYAPNSILGFLGLFALVALLLLVRTNLAEHQRRWREYRIHFNPDIGLDFVRNGLTFSVIVVALAWLSPSLGRNAQVRQLVEPISVRWMDAQQRLNTLYSGLNRQLRPSGSAFGDSLRLGGARNVGNRPVFQVVANQGRYWRAVAFDTFDGRRWLNTGENSLQVEANTVVGVADWQARDTLTQTITLLSPTGNVIFGAPDIYRTSVPLNATVNTYPMQSILVGDSGPEQIASDSTEITLAHSRRTLDIGDQYTVYSRYTQITQWEMNHAPTSYPNSVVDKYLQMPENLSPRVGELAQEVVNNSLTPTETVYEKAAAIEAYLRDSYPYNEEIEAPADDVDPVSYFLFDIKEGYCDYYATAMVMMLRSLGIPARAVSGYAEGTFDEESQVYIITEKDAHTWVEVYFPTYGWVEFEPTAGESELRRPVGEDPNFPESDLIPGAPFDNFDNGLPQDILDEELMNPPEFGQGGDLPSADTGRGWQWWATMLAMPVLLVAGFLFMRRFVMAPSAFTPDLPPILFDRMQRWAERLGLRVTEQNTPYENARRLSRALPDAQTPINTITNSYVVYQFSPHGRNGQEHIDSSASLKARLASSKVDLPGAWQRLQKTFVRVWLRNKMNQLLRRRNPFALVD